MMGAREDGAAAVPRSCGDLSLTQVSVSTLEQKAPRLQLCWGEALGCDFSPLESLWAAGSAPVVLKHCPLEEAEEVGLGFSGRWVRKDQLLQSSESEQFFPGRHPEHQEGPSQGAVLCLWPAAPSLRRWLKSSKRSRAWRLDPHSLGPEAPEAAGQWLLTKRKRSVVATPGQLGIDEGDCDVSSAFGGGEPLVVVCESPGVHQGPALPWGSDGAVVAQEPTAPTLRDRKCQLPNRKCQFPNGTTGPPPTPTPILPSEPSQPRGPSVQPARGCPVSDSHELPKGDTLQRARNQKHWPWRQAALGSDPVTNLNLSLPFWKIGIKLYRVVRIKREDTSKS